MLRTLDLLASDSSHLPFLYVFKESGVMEKYGFEIDLHIVGGAKAPTMAHRAKLALAGEIDFLSGLHHETYRERAKGEKRLTYLAQAQNNWDDRLVALPKIKSVQDLKGQKIVCHRQAPCVAGNLRAVLESCGLNPEEINIEVVERFLGQVLAICRSVDLRRSGGGVGGHAVRSLRHQKGTEDRRSTRSAGNSQYDSFGDDGLHQTKRRNGVCLYQRLHRSPPLLKTQPDKVIPILKKNLAKRYGLEEDEYYIHLQREWARLLSKKPYPLASAIQNVYDLDVGKDPAMKNIGPMEPWDLHYLRAIDDSGFIDRLYAS